MKADGRCDSCGAYFATGHEIELAGKVFHSSCVPERCSGCGNEVDPDTCHCGIPLKDHSVYLGHSFVPIGCACGRHKEAAKR